jgi:GAF domain-containing protein
MIKPDTQLANDRKRTELRHSLLKILDAAMEVDHARCGNIQVFNRETGGLEVCAQRGFDESFLQTFKVVRADDSCACGRALRFRKRVIIPDISKDPFFAPFLNTAQKAGFRSVQSTPIVNSRDDIIGVLSTHFPAVHYLAHESAARLDRYAMVAAEVINELSN